MRLWPNPRKIPISPGNSLLMLVLLPQRIRLQNLVTLENQQKKYFREPWELQFISEKADRD